MKQNSKYLFDFEKLNVYQKAVNFSNEIYIITKGFPKEERFGLQNQLIRAANSVSLNIAEGSSYKKGAFKDFLRRARGSAYECVPCLRIAQRRNYINEENFSKFYSELQIISKMISALISSLDT